MPSIVNNWLAERGVGVMFRLQATPLTADLAEVQAYKPSGSKTYLHNRHYYPLWPEGTVMKVSRGGVVLNDVYLETTSTLKWQNDMGGTVSGISASLDASGDANTGGMFCSCDWVGGDDEVYLTGSVTFNSYQGLDPNGDPFWNIQTRTYERDANGLWLPISESVQNNQPQPYTVGAACVLNGGAGSGYLADPLMSAYASYSTIVTSKDFLDDFTPQGDYTSPSTKFAIRHPDDSPHELSDYVEGYNNAPSYGELFVVRNSGIDDRFNGIFSYEPTASEIGALRNQRARTTCKWMFYSAACEDCWYKGKVVNVEVKYKKLAVSKVLTIGTVSTPPEIVNEATGGWADHDTVSYALTLPEGTGTQQIGASFEVPVVEGYIVCIEDIKFVSVT